MSLDPEAPDDFVAFSGTSDAARVPGPRAVRPLRHRALRLRRARAARRRLRLWRGEAVAVTPNGVVLRSGTTLPAAAVVLATGIVPRVTHPDWHAKVVDAWDECALATLPKQGRLLHVGSGLSALDVLAFLDAQGFAGEVTLMSPRGLLPLPHEPRFKGRARVAAADVQQAPTRARSARALGSRHDRVRRAQRHALAARGRPAASPRRRALPGAAARGPGPLRPPRAPLLGRVSPPRARGRPGARRRLGARRSPAPAGGPRCDRSGATTLARAVASTSRSDRDASAASASTPSSAAWDLR